jgi:hypothetical protein
MKAFIGILTLGMVAGGLLFTTQAKAQIPTAEEDTGKAISTTVEESPASTPSRTLPDYYTIKRVVIHIDEGIIAINPGTKIEIKERLNSSTVKITYGEYEAIVAGSIISNDSVIVDAAKFHHNSELAGKIQATQNIKAQMAEWEKRKQKEIEEATTERYFEDEARKPKVALPYHRVKTDETNDNKVATDNQNSKNKEEQQKAQNERREMQARKQILEKEIDALRIDTKAAFDSANSQNSGVNRMDASSNAHAKQSLLNAKQYELNQLNQK